MTAEEKNEALGRRMQQYKDLKEQFDLLRIEALDMSEALSEAARYLHGIAMGTRPTKTRNVEALQLPDYHKLVSQLESVQTQLSQLEAILDSLGFKPK